MKNVGLLHTAIHTFLKTFAILFGLLAALLVIGLVAGFLVDRSPKIHHQPPQELASRLDQTLSLPSTNKPSLVVIRIKGMIGMGQATYAAVDEQLRQATAYTKNAHSLKGLLLLIDSPGGYATDSQQIYSLLMQFKQEFQVPIYAYIEGLCASGGYMIACAADTILSAPYGQVGSVGVKTMDFFNFTGLMSKAGIQAKTYTAGKEKNPLDPFQPWPQDQDSWVSQLVASDYENFLTIVESSRSKLTKALLKEQYGAKVFPATQGVEIGYIDLLSPTFYSAINEIEKRLHVESLQLLDFEKKSFLQEFLKMGTESCTEKLLNMTHLKTTYLPISP